MGPNLTNKNAKIKPLVVKLLKFLITLLCERWSFSLNEDASHQTNGGEDVQNYEVDLSSLSPKPSSAAR